MLLGLLISLSLQVSLLLPLEALMFLKCCQHVLTFQEFGVVFRSPLILQLLVFLWEVLALETILLQIALLGVEKCVCGRVRLSYRVVFIDLLLVEIWWQNASTLGKVGRGLNGGRHSGNVDYRNRKWL